MSPAPSPAQALGSWDAEDVSVSEVEAALSELRRHEQRAAVRTSVLTLVAVVVDPDREEDTIAVVRELGVRHPSRSLVIVVHEDGDEGDDADEEASRSRIDAKAEVLVSAGAPAVCFEDVVLRVRGPVRFHLESLVEPLTLPDLPVAVWLPGHLPSPGDPLLDSADRIVIDTRAVGVGEDPEVFARVTRLMRKLPVVDLSWVRLGPWRTLLAGLFEGAVHHPFVDAVTRVEVAGNFGPRHLLGGWLLETLGLGRSHVHVEDADHVAIHIDAELDGRRARFSVERRSDERVIMSSVTIDDGPSVNQTLRMRDRWPTRSLADALTELGHDPVYERALAGALRLTP